MIEPSVCRVRIIVEGQLDTQDAQDARWMPLTDLSMTVLSMTTNEVVGWATTSMDMLNDTEHEFEKEADGGKKEVTAPTYTVNLLNSVLREDDPLLNLVTSAKLTNLSAVEATELVAKIEALGGQAEIV
jgi:hypothetical protein